MTGRLRLWEALYGLGVFAVSCAAFSFAALASIGDRESLAASFAGGGGLLLLWSVLRLSGPATV